MHLQLMIPLALLATGCVATPAQVYQYSWGRIIKLDQESLNRVCQTATSKWDNGAPMRFGQNVGGCKIGNDIYVLWSASGAKAIPHELCHLDGKTDCEAYNWE